MVSVISSYALDSIVLEGKDRVKKVSGKLASTSTKPGNLVYQSAEDTWTMAEGSASDLQYSYGWVEFKKRTSATFGEVDIDTAYAQAATIDVEIIIGPKDGTIKLASIINNLGADKYYGEVLTTQSTGSMQLWEGQNTGRRVAIITEDGYTNADTVAKVYMI